MRFFFRSRKFKIILAVLAALIGVSVACAVIGGKMSPQANIAGTVTAPFKALATKISDGISDFIGAYTDGEKLVLENAELESEIAELREKLADYEKVSNENNFYKDYLEIKDKNPSFQFAAATLISREKEDAYKGFTKT